MSKVTILSKPNRIVIASKGVQGPPGPEGIQGIQGIQGPKGDTGDVTPEALAARDAAVGAASAASQSADSASASAEFSGNLFGLDVAVPYASGLNVDSTRFTVIRDGQVYAPAAPVPFTTGAWDPVQWNVVQGDVNLRSDLADPDGGSSLIAYDSSKTVKERLDELGVQTVAPPLADDYVAALRDTTPNGRSYFILGNARSLFGIGQAQGAQRAVEWEFTQDVDGLTRIQYGYFGVVRDPSATVQASNFRDASGTPVDIGTIPVTSDNRFFRPTEVGYKFDIDFNGRGLIFRYYADNRGGLWKITVDGLIERTVSTWAAGAGVADNFFTVVDGLEPGDHTAVFEFMGADPDNPPADGGPRGWFKYDDGSPPTQTTGLVISGDEMAMKWVGRTLGVTSILEFAIRATAEGSGIPMSWIPTHGSDAGTVTIHSRRIFINGIEALPDLSNIRSDAEFELSDFMMSQTYTAYSSFDTGKAHPLWSGVLTHKFERGELSIQNKIKTLTDVHVQDGYFAMASARVPSMDLVVGDNGFSKQLSSPAEQVVTRPGYARSAMFYHGSTGRALGVTVGSLAASSGEGMPWKEPDNPTLLTERGDGFSKWYYQAIGRDKVVPSGQVLESRHTLFMSAGSSLLEII